MQTQTQSEGRFVNTAVTSNSRIRLSLSTLMIRQEERNVIRLLFNYSITLNCFPHQNWEQWYDKLLPTKEYFSDGGIVRHFVFTFCPPTIRIMIRFSVVICRTVMWGYATVKWGTLPHVGYVIASLGSVIARLRYAIVSWGPKSLTKKKLAKSWPNEKIRMHLSYGEMDSSRQNVILLSVNESVNQM